MRRPNGYWNYERCRDIALKYTKKNLFQKEQSSAYNAIYSHKWFKLFEHMKNQGSKFKRLIYVFEFSNNYFYVGLTCNPEKRIYDHLNIGGSVFKFINETGLNPKFMLKTDYLEIEEAIAMENKILEEYLENGWITLNKVKTGNLGSNNRKWTKELCLKEALKYKSISEYQRESKSSYNSALKNGWIDDVCKHMVRKKSKNNFWNDREKCFKEFEKYKNISELQKKNWAVYNFSKKNGWLYEYFQKRSEKKS
jgi:predicted GIY-YIG superfamily endonuclease